MMLKKIISKDKHYSWYFIGSCLLVIILLYIQIIYIIPFNDFFAYTDHPGMYFLLHKTITGSSILGWFPDWYAGYPELANFPPGFFVIGKIIYLMLFGLIDPMGIYKILLVISNISLFLIPYIVLKAFDLTKAQAFWSSLLVMIFFHNSFGAFPGIRFGGNTVLSLGLASLPLFFIIKALKGIKIWYYYSLAGISLGIVFLIHPYHCVFGAGAILAFGTYLVFEKKSELFQYAKGILLAILFFIGLTAFWIIPGLVRNTYAASFQYFQINWRKIFELFIYSGFRIILISSLWYIIFITQLIKKKIQFKHYVLSVLPIFISLLVFINEILVRTNVLTSFNSYQLLTDVMFSITWLAPAGVLEIWKILKDNYRINYGHKILFVFIFIGLFFIMVYKPINKVISDQWIPDKKISSFTLNRLSGTYGFNNLWQWLENDTSKGRVLFTASTFYLFEREKSNTRQFDQFHDASGLITLTPLYAKREIIGATWPHPSNVARFFNFGDPDLKILDKIPHTYCDDKRLFGKKLDELDENYLINCMEALNITRIVIADWELNMIEWFEGSQNFKHIANRGVFHIFAAKKDDYKIYECLSGNVFVEVQGHNSNQYKLWIKNQESKIDSFLFKIAYHPCWHLKSKNNGFMLAPNNIGIMKILVPPSVNEEITLSYQLSLIDKCTIVIFFLTVIATVYIVVKIILK